MKRKCPRCGSSMLLDFSDIAEAFQQVWKCLGCGRETFVDTERQAEDDRVVRGILRDTMLRSSSTA